MNAIRVLVCVALVGCATTLVAEEKKPADGTKKKRLLVITESKGFVHGVVNRGKGPLALAEKVLIEIGEKSGDFEAVCSQDSRKMITKENLDRFDAVFFYTTGSLPISAAQKADFIDFLRKGGGFAGSHSASDTFYDWPEYGKIVGGYFDGHPWHQKIKVVVEDTKHPATRHLGESFEITDEIYQFRTPYDRKRLRVLMRMDRAVDRPRTYVGGKEVEKSDEVKLAVSGGTPTLTVNGKETPAVGFSYQGPRGNRKDGDNALAWIQEYGKGRVFYTALGHRDEVWKDERFQKHLIGGLKWAVKQAEGSGAPSGKP
jgi:type 1 glutamine amidotransferase